MQKRLALLFAAALLPLMAQSDRGRIAGRVFDASGAVIANAAVRAANPATDYRRETRTGPDGRYLLESLLPASYTVTASAGGFADAAVSGLVLSVGQERILELRLQPLSYAK